MSITINGTTGVSGVDGSSTTPAFQGTDTNTGLFYGTDIVGISTGGSERVRVDANGNVGIGIASPSSYNAAGRNIVVGTTSNVDSGITIASGTTATSYLLFAKGTTGSDSYNGYIGYKQDSNYMQFNVNGGVERMRIDSSGNVFVNTTTIRNSGKISVDFNGTTAGGMGINDTASSNGSAFIAFLTGGTFRGSITNNNNTGVTYGTSSDYRLKEDILPMTGALDKVAQLKPVTYKWKIDGSDGQGFIAHELAEVVPDCVVGEKDAVDEEGNPKYQGVDTSYLVATLTAAIQEQQAIINDLKARVTALETSNV